MAQGQVSHYDKCWIVRPDPKVPDVGLLDLTLRSLNIDDAYPCIPVMSSKLLRHAKALGLQVELLCFPNESTLEFLEALRNNKSVKIVRLRNNICHGNFVSDFATVSEEDAAKIYHSDIEATAAELHEMVQKWTEAYTYFRTAD